jgi:hypothetical protein
VVGGENSSPQIKFLLFFCINEQKIKGIKTMAELTGQGKGLGQEAKPTQAYRIIVRIADVDYSADVTSVEIASTLNAPYQIVTIILFIDPADPIIRHLYGDSKVNLTIHMTSETAKGVKGPYIIDTRKFELMILDISHELIERPKSLPDDKNPPERMNVTLTTVSRQSWKTMNTIVNRVFIGQTLQSIITKLSKDAGATGLVYDSSGRNNNSIDQIIVPPTTFYKIIKEHDINSKDPYDGFLDQRFGLFDGVPGVFCQYDGKVYIKNLSARMKQSQTFTIYKLSGDAGADDIVEDSMEGATKGKVFYTRTELKTTYLGNAKLANIAPTTRRIIAPKDTLAMVVEQDLQETAKKYGLNYKGGKLETDSIINGDFRIKYESDTGYERTTSMFVSKLSRQISNMAKIQIQLDRLLWLQNLLDIGEAVKLKTSTVAETEFDGMYILYDSLIKFAKKQEFEATATLNLIRSNRSI